MEVKKYRFPGLCEVFKLFSLITHILEDESQNCKTFASRMSGQWANGPIKHLEVLQSESAHCYKNYIKLS